MRTKYVDRTKFRRFIATRIEIFDIDLITNRHADIPTPRHTYPTSTFDIPTPTYLPLQNI